MDFGEIEHIGKAYLVTPVTEEILKGYLDVMYTDDGHSIGWPEYDVETRELYDKVIPHEVCLMAEAGLAFLWEFCLTNFDSYFAYNFPTEESPNNLVIYRSTSRRRSPKLSKKKRVEIEKTSAANELLIKLGIQNGTN